MKRNEAMTVLVDGKVIGSPIIRPINYFLTLFKIHTMDSTTAKMPEIEGIAPYIEVFDMPISLHFYRDILGFDKKMSSGEGDDVDWVLLEHKGAVLMLNTVYEKENRPAQPDKTRVKGHRDLCFYFDCPDIDGLYQYFVCKGIELEAPIITGYGWKAIYVRDPDEYGLCFHHPVCETPPD
ncbi:VOC family protein [Mucilaginibacter ginsenosidivorans]|uniref:VOC family protein n=1 Tax=Mucilaginibacter ginsenosidivorans TaxID=398053 RepID=A0A5B8UXX8_9SPHI|nr:VOC family protein [Mucilaginibacter ginsenosidivorans]QEC63950.1 VOC family protein [Mucilaginibacter ginsenosidivorans]